MTPLHLPTLAQTHPRLLDFAIRFDRLPAGLWLALQALALLPSWRWMAARLGDGSDDPLGLLALATLAWLVGSQRRQLRAAPQLGWLAGASVGTLLATLLRPQLPPLLASLLALLALACALLAFLPRRQAAAPVLGLAVLALPLLSSLQFYAGFPLRLLTAEASRWLLAPFFQTVLREGSSLWIDGRQVIVDAPCSGVQMVWLGYYSACAAALWCGLGSRQFMARLPVAGALVLLANLLRNSLLLAFEGAGRPLGAIAHNALGLLVLAGVCAAIALLMARPSLQHSPSHTDAQP